MHALSPLVAATPTKNLLAPQDFCGQTPQKSIEYLYAPVAQLDRVADSDSEGRRFKSCRECQKTAICRLFVFSAGLNCALRALTLRVYCAQVALHAIKKLSLLVIAVEQILSGVPAKKCTSTWCAFCFTNAHIHVISIFLPLRAQKIYASHIAHARRRKRTLQDAHMACYFLCLGTRAVARYYLLRAWHHYKVRCPKAHRQFTP